MMVDDSFIREYVQIPVEPFPNTCPGCLQDMGLWTDKKKKSHVISCSGKIREV
jgi:hypothetical protein